MTTNYDYAEWIPVRFGLRSDPAVLQIANRLKQPPNQVVGDCVEFWEWVSLNCDGPTFGGFTPKQLGAVVVSAQFIRAMIAAGWLEFDAKTERFTVPHWHRWLSKTAKLRAMDRERKRQARDAAKADGAAGTGEQPPPAEPDQAGETADKPRTNSGQTPDKPRTNSGQTADKTRTNSGQTPDKKRTARARAHAGTRPRTRERGEQEKDTPKVSFSCSTRPGSANKAESRQTPDEEPTASAKSSRPAGETAGRSADEEPTASAETVSPAGEAAGDPFAEFSGALAETLADGSHEPRTPAQVDPAEWRRAIAIRRARADRDADALRALDVPVPPDWETDAASGGKEESESTGPAVPAS